MKKPNEQDWRHRHRWWFVVDQPVVTLTEQDKEIGTPSGSAKSVRAVLDQLGKVTAVRIHQAKSNPPVATTFFHGEKGFIAVTGFCVARSAGPFSDLMAELGFSLRPEDEQRLFQDNDALLGQRLLITIRRWTDMLKPAHTSIRYLDMKRGRKIRAPAHVLAQRLADKKRR